jgi:glycosyltransferase involved in cell wall biosynthesis
LKTKVDKSFLPLVSIITPSFNQGKYIKQTIDSVLSQSYKKIEYWVIDGGSTDDTIDILKSYGEAINYVSEKDSGQTNAINKGILKTSGEIIGFINSDDVLLPGAIQLVVEKFSHPNILWVTGDYRIIDTNNKQIQSFVILYKRLLRRFSSLLLLSITNYIAQPSTFWHRKLSDRIGLMDETLRYTMDYDYWSRAFRISPPTIIHDILSSFRIHELSKGGREYEKQFDEELLVLKKYSSNKFVYWCHNLHNKVIKAIYRKIK